jgi:hypothetical protein
MGKQMLNHVAAIRWKHTTFRKTQRETPRKWLLSIRILGIPRRLMGSEIEFGRSFSKLRYGNATKTEVIIAIKFNALTEHSQ